MKMGENTVQLVLTRHGARSEAIQLRVPVDYRVAGDMSALDETPSKLRLLIEKSSRVVFEVEKQPVIFDTSGHGHFDIDVTNDLIGQAAVEKPLERRVAYSVRSPNFVNQGAVLMRTGILPLSVDAPGPLFITDREDFKLCGTTSANAHIDVAGLNIAVDSNGHFCHSMVIKEIGRFAIWITASAKGDAPRRVQRVIERTSNLSAYARKLYGEVAHALEKSGTSPGHDATSLIALVGTVVEHSELPPVTRFLLQYGSKHNPQGFVRVVASNQSPMTSGNTVTVFGQVTGSLMGPDGHDMSELSAAFIVPGVP